MNRSDVFENWVAFTETLAVSITPANLDLFYMEREKRVIYCLLTIR